MNEPYWQAEIIDRHGNPSGMTFSENGCGTCVGNGIRFTSKEECDKWILKHAKDPAHFKATEHIDMD